MFEGSGDRAWSEAVRDAVALTLFLAMAWVGLAVTQAWAEGLCPVIY